jgi:hypothetical protein
VIRGFKSLLSMIYLQISRFGPSALFRFEINSEIINPKTFGRTLQTGFGDHPASYPMDTRGSFPGSKAVGA